MATGSDGDPARSSPSSRSSPCWPSRSAIAIPASQVNLGLSRPRRRRPGHAPRHDHDGATPRPTPCATWPPSTRTPSPPTAPAAARGDQPLPPRLEDGAKVFDLDRRGHRLAHPARPPGRGLRGQRPGPRPRLRVTQGDRVRVNVRNNLPEPTSIHWHGLILPNAMDGAADITQPPIAPGATFTYEFTAAQQGSYFYHSHAAADRQQALGLYGALIVDPADPAVDAALRLPARGGRPAAGMAAPRRVHLPGHAHGRRHAELLHHQRQGLPGHRNHPHARRRAAAGAVHRHPQHRSCTRCTSTADRSAIVQTDGEPVPPAAQLLKDTVNVGPGERYDVIWEARQPGKWLLHCHIPHHTTNNNVEEARRRRPDGRHQRHPLTTRALIRTLCWAHVRRHFVRAGDATPPSSHTGPTGGWTGSRPCTPPTMS